MSGWKKLSSKVVHKNPWYSVELHKIQRPDGSKGKFYILKKKDGVIVVPFNGKRVNLINLFRPDFMKRMWEFPAGRSDMKTHLESAKQELREETGFRANKWTLLGTFACGPGHTDHIGKAYLAEKLKSGEPEREIGEQGMMIKAFKISEVDKMIMTGKIIDSWTINAWYYFKEYLKKSSSPGPSPLDKGEGERD